MQFRGNFVIANKTNPIQQVECLPNRRADFRNFAKCFPQECPTYPALTTQVKIFVFCNINNSRLYFLQFSSAITLRHGCLKMKFRSLILQT